MSHRKRNRSSQANVYYLDGSGPGANSSAGPAYPAIGSFNNNENNGADQQQQPQQQRRFATQQTSPMMQHSFPVHQHLPPGVPPPPPGGPHHHPMGVPQQLYASYPPQPPPPPQPQPQPQPMGQPMPGHRFSTDRMGSFSSSIVAAGDAGDEEQADVQKVFIHRRTEKNGEDVQVRFKQSSLRDGEDNVPEQRPVKTEDSDGFMMPRMHEIPFTTADIVFANGNNREKRRAEVFEYYSELYKMKERERENLYKYNRALLEERLKHLSQPRDFNTEVASFEACGKDQELFDIEQDIVEIRDYELVRLRHWRRFQRNSNLKLYVEESTKVYREATDMLDKKLERLKQFFIRQKGLLNNFERDMGDISSARAPKLYSGFVDKPEDGNGEASVESFDDLAPTLQMLSNAESSETDTGASSSANKTKSKVTKKTTQRRVRNPRSTSNKKSNTPSLGASPSTGDLSSLDGQLLGSIVSGYAPILSNEEFFVLLGEDQNTSIRHLAQDTAIRTDQSDSDTATDHSKRLRRHHTLDQQAIELKHKSYMTKIMKGYTPPDDLNAEDVDEDLVLLRSLKQR